MSGPSVLDLFSGACGGWSLGMHRAGFKTVAACEADPWRRSVYAHNFPGVKLYEDVRTLGSAELVRDLGRLPDVIVGSPPCQDASAANTKGLGVDGERTKLFFEAIRIVGECRPRWCAFENSPRLRTRGVDRLLVELEALGYTCWPFVVGADDLGAPHERKRMWLLCADTEIIGRRAWPSRGLGFLPSWPRHEAHEGENAADAKSWGSRPRPYVTQSELAARAPHHSDADRQGEPRLPVDDEVAGQLVVPGDTDGAGLAFGESLTGDARAQFEALERAVGPRGAAWNGRSAGHLELAHGLSARLAGIRVPDHKRPGRSLNAGRACISAYGDAVVPKITEIIGRAILRTEEALHVVC